MRRETKSGMVVHTHSKADCKIFVSLPSSQNSVQDFEEPNIMSQTPRHWSRYEEASNNIVIVPTVLITKNGVTPLYPEEINLNTLQLANNMEQPKPFKEDQSKSKTSTEHPTPSMDQLGPNSKVEQIQSLEDELMLKPSETASNEDVNQNLADVRDLNKTKKVNSWASNYIQSIGHNNKPTKIKLSMCTNKLQKMDTTSAKNNESIKTDIQSAHLIGTTSSYEVFNMTNKSDNRLEFNKPNKKTVGEQMNIDKIKTYPTNVNVCRAHTNKKNNVQVIMAPVFPRSGNKTSTSVNDNHSGAPAYATPLAKNIGCYNGGKCEIDILDSIKSKINCEPAIEQKELMMNLPTHKDMCEDFIKEISINKASTSKRMKNDYPKSSPAKNEKITRHTKRYKSTTKPETKLKNLIQNDKKVINKEFSKSLKKQDRGNTCKSSFLKKDKSEKKDRNKHIDLKDFGSLCEHIIDKKPVRQPETHSHSPERKKLKRVHTNSEVIHKTISDVRTQSPIANVVQVAENCVTNPPKRQCLDESFDLRSKLSRANQKIYKKTHMPIDTQSMNKKPKQRDNLKITVENQIAKKPKSPKKKCKTLKLIIEVVCQGSDDETTSSDSSNSETEKNPTRNTDLSFLDDFNVDEIVDCLKHSPNKIKSPFPPVNKMEGNTERPSALKLKQSTINVLHAKSESNIKNLATADYNAEETIKNNRKNTKNEPLLPHRSTNNEKENNKSATIPQKMDVEEETAILDKNEESILINLTSNLEGDKNAVESADQKQNFVVRCIPRNPSENDENNINDEAGEQKDAKTQIEIMNEELVEQKPHLILLRRYSDTNTSEKNVEAVEIKTGSTDQKIINKTQIEKNKKKEKPKDIPENETHPDNSLGDSDTNKVIYKDNTNEESFETNAVKIIVNDKTVKVRKEVNIKMNEENPKKEVKNESETNMGQCNTAKKNNSPKETQNMGKVIENESVIIVNKNVVENNIKMNEENPKKEVKNESETNMGQCNTAKKNNSPKETHNMGKVIENESVIIVNKNVVEDNIKINEETPKKEVKNESETNMGQCYTAKKNNSSKETQNMCKVIENESVIIVNKNLIEYVGDTINKSENTQTNNDTKNKPGNTKSTNNTKNDLGNKSKTSNKDTTNEPVNTSKTNKETKNELGSTSNTKNAIGNKANLTAQRTALAVLLKQRIFEYLHIEIKIIQHIHLGKYSNIFSCTDSEGRSYAAKVLTERHNLFLAGLQTEQMIRKLQQDIPNNNLNTIYLIDGFGIERCWCFLTEYYPKNLQEVLNEQKDFKPFHIDRVQHMARQLISAVMALRNNEIVHSDIKPSHILVNAAHNRLKLCGFDGAYYMKNVHLLPNIGTAIYRAPEIILGFCADYSIDVWSSALVIYQMTTNHKLFTGIYNNDILFKQMSTFGNLPQDMIDASFYRNKHFQGATFMKRTGYHGQDAILFRNFYKSKRLQMTMLCAYDNYWATREGYQRDIDMFKLTALHKLLEQMLILDPRRRLAIEFVCTNPFIYEALA